MKITSEWLHAQATAGCGWTKKQLAVLGVPSPPRAGWLKALVGREISEEAREQFEAHARERRQQRVGVVAEEIRAAAGRYVPE